MPAGQRFRLKTAIVALDTSGGKSIAVTVPIGGIIEVAEAPRPENGWMLVVRWNEKAPRMFVEDVRALTKPFEPDQFKNQFRERLNQLIASRAAEHQITAVETPRSGKVIDIMDALRRSLAKVKSVEQAPRTERKPVRQDQQANDKQSKRRGNKKPG